MLAGTYYNKSEKIWHGPDLTPLYSANVSLGQVLMASLNRSLSDIGQICYDDGTEMKNSEILQNSIRVALNLKDLGLKEGDVIGVAARNSKFLSAVVIGALTIGTPISTIDPTFEREDIAHIFQITEPKIVLCDMENQGDVRTAMQDIGNKCQVYVFGKPDGTLGLKHVGELLKEHPGENNFVIPKISDGTKLPAFIVCSSGTTGPSKAVNLSHAALAHQVLYSFSPTNSKRFLCFSSLYWLSGVAALLLTTCQGIARVITVQPFTPERFLDIVKTHQVHSLITSPPQFAMVLRYSGLNASDLDSVIEWFCGGSHLSRQLAEQMNEYLHNGRVRIIYGCSEISGPASITQTNYDSVGKLIQGVFVKIIDDNGRRLGPGERGEISLKCVFPIQGYNGNEEATKAAVIDGWFHSGDEGYVDEDGELYVVDRKKDIIKHNNYQIDPSGIEKVIEKLPGVVMVTVVAVPHLSFATDLPAAVIVKSSDSTLTQEDVHEYTKVNLPSYKWLRGGVYFVDKMPLTPSGKVIKRKCREMILDTDLEENSLSRWGY